MNIRKIGKILILVSVISVIFGSCIIDTKPLVYTVRNCTSDTFLIQLTTSDTLDNELCWGKNPRAYPREYYCSLHTWEKSNSRKLFLYVT